MTCQLTEPNYAQCDHFHPRPVSELKTAVTNVRQGQLVEEKTLTYH